MKIISSVIIAAAAFCCLSHSSAAATDPIARTQNPLVASYSVAAPAGSAVAVEFGPDANYGFRTSAITVPLGTSSVSILVAGMRQNSTYHMRAITTLPDGAQRLDSDRTFTTGSAPAGRIPATAVTIASKMTPARGVELLGLNRGRGPAEYNLRLVALDPAGELIWYYDFDLRLGIAQPVKLLPNGHFLANLPGNTSKPEGVVREFDLAGNTIREFTPQQINRSLAAEGYGFGIVAIHHDLTPLPNGHILLLVTIEKKFRNLPGYHGVTTVSGDGVIDLDRTFKPVWVWSSFDHLDVNRHPYLFPDWTHTNTIVYSPDDGNILLSVRNQDWIIKIDYANGRGTGKILWKLGYHGDFTLLNSSSPADWFYAQHFANFLSPNTTGDFRLALFDNGNNRLLDSRGTTCVPTDDPAHYFRPAMFGAGPPLCSSRSAILDVNETARTAELLWSYDLPYSNWGGVTSELPSGNIFFDVARWWNLSGRPVDEPKHPLIDELAILTLVVLIFFWRIPSTIIPFLTLAIALILAFVPVLGGIAVAMGVILDAAVVMFAPPDAKPEPPHADARRLDYYKRAISALKGIARPSFFALLVVAVSFLPVFTPLDDPTGAHVMEVTQQKSPKIIWELHVNGQQSYRTLHLPSLYPGVQW
ncbi:MAG: aryl-sulfate sulfotransferase [Candidatus Sulfotelmatobacter sp.]